jgi:hypothetical protein
VRKFISVTLVLIFVVSPIIALPFAPFFWLLMVAVGVAPMTWKALLFNWFLLSMGLSALSLFNTFRSAWRQAQQSYGQGDELIAK